MVFRHHGEGEPPVAERDQVVRRQVGPLLVVAVQAGDMRRQVGGRCPNQHDPMPRLLNPPGQRL